jgi:glycosyltransferase involved in cell wall biosynthesis
MNHEAADKALVSIVLPTYNRARVLPYAIRSVLDQTYRSLELIIVDDNSSDGTRNVVDSFSDERIRYMRNEPNLKLPRALNRGFGAAKGAYLTWTSDDNIYADTAIERMVEALQTKDGEFVYADYFLFADLDSAGNPVDLRHERLPDQAQLEKSNHIGACFLYTREVYEEVGSYDPELFLVEDYDYFMRIAKRFRMLHIPEPLYYFRRDDETLFCSRFCEVKAADVLVRYKNGLLDDEAALDAVVSLIMRNPDGLRNPVLSWSYREVKKVSFRLTRMHKDMMTKYMRQRLRKGVMSVLEGYRSKRMKFGEAKEGLKVLMTRLGKIEYIQPKLESRKQT